MNKTLYLIGNGFDLHHNLKTSYAHYKDFLRSLYPNFVEQMDGLFRENGIPDDDIEYWSKLEEHTRFFPDLDYETMLENALDASEQDMDRAGYWDDPPYIAKTYGEEPKNFFEEFTCHFREWIDSIEICKKLKDEQLDLEPSALFLNFNYTKSLEILYKVPAENILYIHVDGANYVFGNNQPSKEPYLNPERIYIDEDGRETSDDDPRQIEVKKELNGIYSSIHGTFFKNSRGLIGKNVDFFSKIAGISRIVVMGLSIGIEDEIYINYISGVVDKSCEWHFYYHSDSDKRTIEKVVAKFNIQNEAYIKW